MTHRTNRRSFLRRGLGATLGAGLGLATLGGNVALAGYPRNYFTLKVPWLCQVPPGDWSLRGPGPDGRSPNGTKHCGQAVSVQLAGYFKGRSVSKEEIIACDKWLADKSQTGNSWYLDVNGYYTNFSGANTLGMLLSKRYGLQYGPACGRDPSDVVNQVAAGRPCIVGVMIAAGKLVASGGESHWALVIGWDGAIILNDPGTTSGSGKRYSVSDFDASWATSGRTFASVWK